MRWGKEEAGRLLRCPLSSPGPQVPADVLPPAQARPVWGRLAWGRGARLPVTAPSERAPRLLWAAPGWLLGSSSWEAF